MNTKIEDIRYNMRNSNSRRKQDVIIALVNNSLTTCGIVRGNVDFNTFNTWLKKY